MLIMMIFYGLILAFGAKTIADGSEDLLEVFPDQSALIGGLLLPILGAVPDATMILVSGIFGTREDAQTQVSVGMGTLAGSTIMLLTVPWSASLILGRTTIRHGESQDGEIGASLTTMEGWSHTGITVDHDTMLNARIAGGVSVAFLLGQIVAFFYLKDEEVPRAVELESKVSLAGFVICAILFVLYIAYQLYIPKIAEWRNERIAIKNREKKLLLQALLVVNRMRDLANVPVKFESQQHEEKHKDEQNKAVALSLGAKWKSIAAQKKQQQEEAETSPLTLHQPMNATKDIREDSEEEGEEEPRWMKILKCVGQMLVGALLVTLFSDPIVNVISLLGEEMQIGAFYISFVVTPICSNASELIASLVFASSKTKQASSMTYSQLYGAATMNATLGLSIFYALIHFRGLAWTFSAETLSILFITWSVCLVASFKKTFSCWWIIPNLMLYPLSLVFVFVLEHFAQWT